MMISTFALIANIAFHIFGEGPFIGYAWFVLLFPLEIVVYLIFIVIFICFSTWCLK